MKTTTPLPFISNECAKV